MLSPVVSVYIHDERLGVCKWRFVGAARFGNEVCRLTPPPSPPPRGGGCPVGVTYAMSAQVYVNKVLHSGATARRRRYAAGLLPPPPSLPPRGEGKSQSDPLRPSPTGRGSLLEGRRWLANGFSARHVIMPHLRYGIYIHDERSGVCKWAIGRGCPIRQCGLQVTPTPVPLTGDGESQSDPLRPPWGRTLRGAFFCWVIFSRSLL